MTMVEGGDEAGNQAAVVDGGDRAPSFILCCRLRTMNVWSVRRVAMVVPVAALAIILLNVSSRLWTLKDSAQRTVQLGWQDGKAGWTGGLRNISARGDASLLPPEWNSTACMRRWGLQRLQSEPDPAGYIIFVDGREQLGSNRHLLSDGLFIAKVLNRTLVEYPAANSRISGAGSDLGFGAYWNFDHLCRYHRILGLAAFRSMIEEGRLDVDTFITMSPASNAASAMSSLKTEEDVRKAYRGYQGWPVIVLKGQWQSGIRREPTSLIRPPPFYGDLARRLIDEQKGWKHGAFLAVQWRTETAAGNLTTCYQHVRDKVESYREQEGFGRDQVFFNTDLEAETSGTYASKQSAARGHVLDMISEDYPASMNNSVHNYLADMEDSGVRSIASGVVAASSRVLLASTKRNWAIHRGVCQKVHSNFIDLVVEWREIAGPDDGRNTTVSLFPAVYFMNDHD